MHTRTSVHHAPALLASERRRIGFLGWRHLTCAAILLLLMPAVASLQDVTEPALKAAFIYNFAKFTEWPTDVVPAAAPLVMCVLGDPAVGDALERAVKGRVLAGHSLRVVQVPAAGTKPVCHVLYVSGVTPVNAGRVVVGLRDTAVLTISDVEGFTERGGIAQFFFEQGQLRFSVEVASARRARLQISSMVLELAKRK
jgi:hypothetical protein